MATKPKQDPSASADSSSYPIAGFRLDPAIKEAAERAASDDSRTFSSLVVKILSDWLRREGYLPRKSRVAARR